MKFQELKDKMKDKFMITISAGVLVFSLVVTGVSCTVYAAKNHTDSKTKTESTTDDDVDTDALIDDILGTSSVSEKEIGKEETVYLISDANGSVQQTIVSDHLVNEDQKDTLDDKSNLTDIENVKGDETFTESNGTLTWNAQGNDIYYQGTTTEEAPVSQKVTYYLDGKEISPEDLAGKSGKVTIRFDYTNNTSYTETIDGEEVTVNVPFAAISAVLLNDGFSNVEVTNGKVVDTGSSKMVVGYAVPGLTESLQLEESDLEDINIPEYVEITADVENFSMNVAMTVVANAGNFVSTGDVSLDSIDDLINTLSDASTKLEDGSSDLAEGMDSLVSGLEDYTEGASKLNDGLSSLKSGSGSLASGVTQLDTGADNLCTGLKELKKGAGTLSSGLTDLSDGADSLSSGLTTLSNGADALNEGLSTLNGYSENIQTLMTMGVQSILDQVNTAGASFFQIVAAASQNAEYATVTTDNVAAVTEYVAGNQQTLIGALMTYGGMDQATATATYQQMVTYLTQAAQGLTLANSVPTSLESLSEGAATLAEGAQTAEEGAAKLATGADNAESGALALAKGAKSAYKGSKKLAEGTQSLADAVPTLTSGIKALVDGSQKLVSNNDALLDGAYKLAEGSETLAEGMTTFNEEGIDKIVEAYNGDVTALVNRIQAVKNAADSYGAFTDAAEGVNTSVKFIYKLAEIEAK